MNNFIFYRRNAYGAGNDVLQPRTEKEIRVLIGVSGRNIERAIAALKRGKTVRTPYATYFAVPAEKPAETRAFARS